MAPSQADKADVFRALHLGDTFVTPNPWDAGSAQALASLGFKALASTGGGFAHSLGREDGETSLDEVIEHAKLLVDSTDLPVAMDLENGYGADPDRAVSAIRGAANAGAVGGSIEDWDPSGFFYSISQAAERIAAAAEAARSLAFPFTLTARADNYFRDIHDLDDTIRRLQAYEAAGADVVFAPGLRTYDEIRTVRSAVTVPLSVIALPGMTTQRLSEAGAQRISVPWLRQVAMQATTAVAVTIRDSGEF